jgi:cob(I)alamin adenosyltransferase
MNKDELVGYIQGLLDMNKETEESMDNELAISSMESKLLVLMKKALQKHKTYINKDDINYFNKKADEYSTPLGNTNTQ